MCVCVCVCVRACVRVLSILLNHVTLALRHLPCHCVLHLCSVCDILFTMAEHNFVPSVETIELFIVAVGRAHSVDMEATEQL